MHHVMVHPTYLRTVLEFLGGLCVTAPGTQKTQGAMNERQGS